MRHEFDEINAIAKADLAKKFSGVQNDFENSSSTPNASLTKFRLDKVLEKGRWSKSSKGLFNQILNRVPAESEKTEGGMSCQWFFLQLLLHGSTAPSDRYYSTSAIFDASGLTADRLRKLQQRIGGEPAKAVKGSGSIFVEVDLAEILTAAASLGQRFGNEHNTSIRHIVAAFIFRTTNDGRLLSYLNLESLKINPDELLRGFRKYIGKGMMDTSSDAQKMWNHAIELLDNGIIGKEIVFSREASNNEKCLEIDKYAEVLARLMWQADDKEFNLAIYGHWGRGKTYLMQHTAEVFCNPPKGDSREYGVLNFSAWKYPSRPEVWIHLYETFAKSAFDKGFFKSFPNVIRTGIARHGYWKLVYVFLLGFLSLLPLWPKFQLTVTVLLQIYSALGVTGIIFIISLISRTKTTHKRLQTEYLKAKRHSDKLGLQAIIGEDLVALLKGWLPATGYRPLFYIIYYVFTIYMVGICMWRIQSLWISIMISIFVFTGSHIVRKWLFPVNPIRKKMLLVVDDLDRCDPGHLLSVMESIKLMLEDPEISSRVMTSMLIEEDILRHALWRKYSYLADDFAVNALGTHFNGARIIRENCEKLFTVHLRLPPLEPNEVSSVVDKFALNDNFRIHNSTLENSNNEDSSSRSNDGIPRSKISKVGTAKLYIDDDVSDAITLLAASTIVLGEEERSAIASELSSQRISNTLHDPLGPRAIRAFIFRYQLTRLILTKRGIIDWNPTAVISALANNMFQSFDPSEKLNNLAPEIASIIKQVT